MLSAEDAALLAEFEKRQDHMYADRTWIAKRYAGVQDDSVVHPEMTFREWEWCCFANEKVPHLLAMIRRLLSEAEPRLLKFDARSVPSFEGTWGRKALRPTRHYYR